MAISAQDKILYVANKLGLSTLKDMQGSTGAVYDVDTNGSGVLFGNASQHTWVRQTNVNDNKFEVNSALLVETIAFFMTDGTYQQNLLGDEANGLQGLLNLQNIIVFDLIIGNKVVMKDTPIFGQGGPYTFATVSQSGETGIPGLSSIKPRHQIFMEGAGILIPPQVEYSINFKVFNVLSGAVQDLTLSPAWDQGYRIGAYLFGTQVLLNFNTTI